MTQATDTLPSYATFFDRDPFDFFERVRAQGPVIWDEGMQAWLVTGYKDVAFVQRHEEIFVAPWPRMDFESIFGRRTLFMIEGDAHRRLYGKIAQFFTKAVIDDYRVRFIRPLVEARLDRVAPLGRAELAEEFAQEIPVRVIGSMLGVPWQDEQMGHDVWQWTSGFLAHTGTWILPDAGRDTQAAAEDSMARLDDILRPLVRRDAVEDPESYIARLWEFGPQVFADWDERDVLENCRFLFIAGVHTTTELLCNALYAILTTEGLEERLRSDRALIVPFIEEVLRLSPSMHVRMRIVGQDTTLGGVPLRVGQRVLAVTAAANRDPGRFRTPAGMDLARHPAGDHLTFNRGPRSCAGAPLARAEAFEVIDALLERVEDLRFDTDQPSPINEGFLQRAFRPLHAVYRDRRAEPPRALRRDAP
jgi:cytochrome P450